MRVGEDFGVGRRFLALVAAVCTLGSLAVAPLANAEDASTSAPDATSSETSTAPAGQDTSTSGTTADGDASGQPSDGFASSSGTATDIGSDEVATACDANSAVVLTDADFTGNQWEWTGFSKTFKDKYPDAAQAPCFAVTFGKAVSFSLSGYKFATVTVNAKVKSERAFAGTNIDKLVIGANVPGVAANAFKDAQIGELELDSTKGLDISAYRTAKSIGKVTFGSNVTSIPQYLFKAASTPTVIGDVTIPVTVTSIGADSFRNAIVGNLTISADLSKAGSAAFQELKAASVSINGSGSIQNRLFQGAVISGDLSIADAVTKIGVGAFANVTVNGTATVNGGVTNAGDAAFSNAKIGALVIGDNVNEISSPNGNGSGGIFHNATINDVTIGARVATIGVGQFRSAAISTLTFKDRAQDATSLSIGTHAFSGNKALKEVHFPKGLETLELGDSAFRWNSNLATVTYPDGLTTFTSDQRAFQYTSLNGFKLPDSLTSLTLGPGQFQNDNRDPAKTQIGNLDLSNLKNLAKVDIQGWAFTGSNVTSVEFPSKVSGDVTLDKASFKGNASLTSVTLPKTVEGDLTIADQSFANLSTGLKINLPTTVTGKVNLGGITANDPGGRAGAPVELVAPQGVENVTDEYFEKFNFIGNMAGMKIVTADGKELKFPKAVYLYSVNDPTAVDKLYRAAPVTVSQNDDGKWESDPLPTTYELTGYDFVGYTLTRNGKGEKPTLSEDANTKKFTVTLPGPGEYTLTRHWSRQKTFDALQRMVDAVRKLDKDSYTYDSWNAVDKALTDAQAVLDNANATEEQAGNALNALKSAVDKLVRRPSTGGGSTGPTYVTGLTVSSKPNKVEYRIGEQFDGTGMVIKYQSSNGSSYVLGPDQYTVTLDTSKPGKVKAFVTLNSDPSKATSFEVTVVISDVKVHRLYNPRSGEHFYVSSENEYNALIKSGQWRDEGIGFTMVDYGTPVYRLYNPGGKHLFTTSVKERDVLIRAKWNYEGVAFYVPESSDGSDDSATKVHRLYNPGNGDHLLTTSTNERGVLVMHGWRDEGTAFTAK